VIAVAFFIAPAVAASDRFARVSVTRFELGSDTRCQVKSWLRQLNNLRRGRLHKTKKWEK
jgi:hypothetical protein